MRRQVEIKRAFPRGADTSKAGPYAPGGRPGGPMMRGGGDRGGYDRSLAPCGLVLVLYLLPLAISVLLNAPSHVCGGGGRGGGQVSYACACICVCVWPALLTSLAWCSGRGGGGMMGRGDMNPMMNPQSMMQMYQMMTMMMGASGGGSPCSSPARTIVLCVAAAFSDHSPVPLCRGQPSLASALLIS